MGLFSIFGKKDLEAEQKLLKKIEELEQTIARKDKEISDLINELDRVIKVYQIQILILILI